MREADRQPPRLMAVTYADPCWAMHPEDLNEPTIYTVVGWMIEAPWQGWIGIAAERRGDEFAAITFLPQRACVLTMKELS